MKKVVVLVTALLMGIAISANAQDNPRQNNTSSRITTTQSPRETHRVNSNTESNSKRPTIAPKQQSSSCPSSSRSTSSNSNNDRVQRDAKKNSQYEFGKPKN